MLPLTTKQLKLGFWFLLFIIFLTACSNNATPAVDTLTPEVPTATAVPPEPTSTPEPAAAVVNGERVPLAWFEGEVARYLSAQEVIGQSDFDEAAARRTVLDDLIDQVLLAQAAQDAGADVSDADIQARIDDLSAEVDLPAWMATWGYTETELAQSLKMEMLAAYQRELISKTIPDLIEQVELQQVFAYTEEGAENALVSLNSGRSFEDVAFEYDPVTGGYLGWVPRGYLLIPAVEEAAFSLTIGAYSDIIESEIGFHIVQVLDREERPLTTDARLTLQRKALSAWLQEQRESSTIEVLID